MSSSYSPKPASPLFQLGDFIQLVFIKACCKDDIIIKTPLNTGKDVNTSFYY